MYCVTLTHLCIYLWNGWVVLLSRHGVRSSSVKVTRSIIRLRNHTNAHHCKVFADLLRQKWKIELPNCNQLTMEIDDLWTVFGRLKYTKLNCTVLFHMKWRDLAERGFVLKWPSPYFYFRVRIMKCQVRIVIVSVVVWFILEYNHFYYYLLLPSLSSA